MITLVLHDNHITIIVEMTMIWFGQDNLNRAGARLRANMVRSLPGQDDSEDHVIWAHTTGMI